ncbi:hypothetical protein BKA61DRAFT_721019 [Leptodontidium sp. MPI-SDFR-AT-0119]|nr:hypothetical protein BKA61DRAFT_721019 [Leptodontidium sp. MPI-SDFR-AT-0119]
MKLRSTRVCKPRAPLQLQSNSNQTISGPRRRSSRLQLRQRSILTPHILGSQSPLEQRPTDPPPSQFVRATSYTHVPTSTPIEVSAPDFGTKLQQNKVVYTSFDAQALDDVANARKLLDRLRESEPPDRLDYKEYLVLTEDYENKLSVEISAYLLLTKRTKERGISGYFQRPNHAWSAVDNHLTTGLSDTQPDIIESYRKTDYPLTAVEALSGDLAPSSYNEAMPAYAVEFKSTNGDMKEAKLQCVYDGALMTAGAHAMHTHIGKPDDNFYGRTQALTVAFNGETLNFYAYHAVQIPTSSHPATCEASGRGVDRSAGAANETAATIEYHQYLLNCDNPRVSFEAFQTVYRHTRNAQDIGYKWATERKDALWAYTNGDNTQTSPDVATSAQQLPNDSLVSMSSGTPNDHGAYDDGVPMPAQQPTDSLIPVSGPLDGYNYDASDNDVDPTDQLLRESWMDNGCASPDTQIYNPITPPQSSKDVSVLLKSQQLSVPTVIGPGENVDSNARSHRKTRAPNTSRCYSRRAKGG